MKTLAEIGYKAGWGEVMRTEEVAKLFRFFIDECVKVTTVFGERLKFTCHKEDGSSFVFFLAPTPDRECFIGQQIGSVRLRLYGKKYVFEDVFTQLPLFQDENK